MGGCTRRDGTAAEAARNKSERTRLGGAGVGAGPDGDGAGRARVSERGVVGSDRGRGAAGSGRATPGRHARLVIKRV